MANTINIEEVRAMISAIDGSGIAEEQHEPIFVQISTMVGDTEISDADILGINVTISMKSRYVKRPYGFTVQETLDAVAKSTQGDGDNLNLYVFSLHVNPEVKIISAATRAVENKRLIDEEAIIIEDDRLFRGPR